MSYGHQLQTRTVRNADGSVHKTETVTRNPVGQPVKLVQTNPPSAGSGQAQTQTLAYDSAHRLIRHTDDRNSGATKALDYDWSPGGMLNLMQDNEGNRTDYLYDGVGRLIGIWAPNFDYLAFSHDAGGRLTEKWQPNGSGRVAAQQRGTHRRTPCGCHTARFSYNPDGSLATLTNRTAANTVLTSHAYSYDSLGRRTRHSETTGTLGSQYNQYAYDPLSRLTESQTCATSAYAACTAQETNTYDIWDNRKTSATASGTLAYVYDQAHQLKEIRQTSDSGALLASYSYDANGNQTSRPGQTLAWNPLNQLAGIASESYAYDPEGRRIKKTSTSTGISTHYRYNGMDIHA